MPKAKRSTPPPSPPSSSERSRPNRAVANASANRADPKLANANPQRTRAQPANSKHANPKHANAKPANPKQSSEPTGAEMKGWAAIAQFLGMPVSTVQRWSKEGMPVTRAGRNVVAVREELNRWLQRTTGEATGTHVVTPETDLLKDLRASVAAKKQTAPAKPKR